MRGSCTASVAQAGCRQPAGAAGAAGTRRPARQRRQAVAPRCSSAPASATGPTRDTTAAASAAAASNSSSSSTATTAAPAVPSTAPSSFRSSRTSAAAVSSRGRSSSRRGEAPCRVRPVENSDYWAAADLHCCAFYPRATPFWYSALRVDRVMSMQMGKERQDAGRFICLVAEAAQQQQQQRRDSSSSDSSSSSSSGAQGWGGSWRSGSGTSSAGLSIAERDALAAATGRVDLGPLADVIVRLFFPPSMRLNYAHSYSGAGLRGVVVVDTVGDHIPPKRREMPNGTVREVPRSGIAYLSNLAVAPCCRRAGVGRRLIQEAEEVAAGWGCRSIALHVDPTNTPAMQMYERAGYRRIMNQPEWQRILEGRSHPLVLMMRALPWEARQRAKRHLQQQQQQ